MLQYWWRLGKYGSFKTVEQGDEALQQHEMIKHLSPAAAFLSNHVSTDRNVWLCSCLCASHWSAKYKDCPQMPNFFFLFENVNLIIHIFALFWFVFICTYLCNWEKVNIIVWGEDSLQPLYACSSEWDQFHLCLSWKGHPSSLILPFSPPHPLKQFFFIQNEYLQIEGFICFSIVLWDKYRNLSYKNKIEWT